MAKSGDNGSIGYLGVVSIGVGGMVGGGIFAVLGLAVQMGGGGTPLAFAVAGAVALLTAYTYARLSVAYPSQGGTVEFLNKGFGVGLLTGTANILLWMSYVVMLALYAHAFGSYGASFFSDAAQPLWRHLLASAAVLLMAGLNVASASLVGELEDWVVGIKVLILLFFVGVGFTVADLGKVRPSQWSDPLSLVAGGMIIFLAYEGFELIANTAEDVRSPEKTLPRAYFTAVGFVVALYVAVSTVTVGSLPVSRIVEAKDYALAAAAEPALGHAGFVLIAVAAMMSTGSAINATLYGASRLSYIIARDGELPAVLERKVWNRPLEGLVLTVGATLLLANLVNLSSISLMGSAAFLLIFMAVNLAGVTSSRRVRCNPWVSGAGALACLAALVALLWQRATVAPAELLVLPVMVGVSFAIEYGYRRISGRKIQPDIQVSTESH